jgi:hypothetical protein
VPGRGIELCFSGAVGLDSARVGATKERGRVTRQPKPSDLTFPMLAGPGPRPAPAGCGAGPTVLQLFLPLLLGVGFFTRYQ